MKDIDKETEKTEVNEEDEENDENETELQKRVRKNIVLRQSIND